MENDLIEVMIACNGEYGNIEEDARQFEFRWLDEREPEPMLDFYADIPYEEHYNEGYILVDNVRYNIKGYGTMVGNVYWDAVQMLPTDAVQLINQLIVNGAVCQGGFEEVFEKAEAEEPITEEDLLVFMPF